MARAKFETTPENIKEFRRVRGWSRPKFGAALGGVSPQTVKNWETEITEPPPYLRLAMLYIGEKSIGGTIKEHQSKLQDKDDPFAI